MRWFRVLGTVLVALLVAAACSSDSDPEVVAEAPTEAVDEAAQPEETEAAEATAEPTAAPTATPEPPTPTPVPPTPESEPEDAAESAPGFDFSEVATVVETYVEENNLNGAGLIVVHRDHGVVYHDHWGEFDESRISLIASSSKMITAGVLLNLDDRGLLDIDAPVADAAEWGASNPDITPAQLISNSSGLVGLLPDPAYLPYVCQYLAAGSLQACAETIMTTDADDDDIIAPDSEFRYGGAQWQVAGAVAEVASGQSWAELIDEIYVQPCGLETLAYNNHFTQMGGGFSYPERFAGDPETLRDTDNPNMEGGAYVTTGDYGKLLLMHLRDGMCGDTQVLSPEALERMHGDRIGAVYDGDAFGPGQGYGMGWWVDRETGLITDGGAYGSHPWLDLEDGHGAYLVVEASSAIGNQLGGLLYEPVEAALLG